MANTLEVYNPIFYAQEALIQLEKALGMAARVHRGFETERAGFGRGETISIRKPASFTAQSAPSSAQDLDTETVNITLANWKEVKFSLTDRELAFTGERIIEDHIRPAAVALADDIDQALVALANDVPWYYDLSGTPVVADITGPRRVLFDNKAPITDGNVHYMINSTLEQGFLGLAAFSQQQGAGSVGVETQLRGSLGMKYNAEVFANQNVPSHVKGTASTGTLALDGSAAPVPKGLTTINLDAVSVTGTLVPGDTFVIAGNTQRYAVTNTVAADTNAFAGVTISPALVQEYADDAVVTVSLDDHVQNLIFHRNAFAVVLAPLPQMARELGAKVSTVVDPITGLSCRESSSFDTITNS